MDLSQKPEVRGLIRDEIRRGNETLPDAQKVRRFLLLTKDLEADDAEMTRTRKVRRRYVAEKYAPVIDAFYCGPRRRRADARPSPTRTAARARCDPPCTSRTSRGPSPMSDDFGFFLLLMSNGVLIGLMYSLIALGFVLVYKATDAINFAQGEFVMIAGLRGGERCSWCWGAPLWLAVLLALVGHGRASASPSSASCCASSSAGPSSPWSWPPSAWRRSCAASGRSRSSPGTKPLPLPIRDEPFVLGPLFIPPIQLLGAAVSLVFLAGFGWFFLKSRKGIAMRAVADNQQVAMAMGINVERYFGVAWAMTGIVSALGGILWGNLLGVDVNLALVGFKVFPVVILGGLDSIPGAIIGGLIVGIVENVAAGYVDPYVGGGTKDFAPYVLMIMALMVRPYGIFGKKIIERI